MFEALRKFFRSPAGMAVAVVLVLLGIYAAYSSLRGFTTTEAAELSSQRMYIDTKTGKTVPVKLKAGMSLPDGLVPAEACYWTKDGKEKKDPTWVLLNLYKGIKDPTFCPDCGRLVVGHNPRPGPDVRPPPTKEEYKPRSSAYDDR